MKLLAVDDDLKVRETLSKMISRLGFECISVTNGREALGVLRENNCSIVISDIRMPGINGIELLNEIKENYPNIDVISITGYSDDYSFTDMIKAGASDFITKPFSQDELEAKLNRIVRERELKSEVERRSKKYREKSEKLEQSNKKLNETIEELKQTQSFLVQSEKMASIGQLAAGVAHEINNPTGYIHSNLGSLNKYVNKVLELLKKYEEGLATLKNSGHTEIISFCEEIGVLKKKLKIDFITKDLNKVIADSLEGTERIKRIVADLKSFSRVDQGEFKHADINEGLESTLNVVWNELKYKCTVEKDFGDLPQIYCNLGQLNQVFMNLLVNAAQAIENKGTITISTRYSNGKLGKRSKDQDYIEVKISDTGCGIPEDKQNRIFEPFFTTKPVGKGTGLGLSIAYDIIQKHKGEIKVVSEVGKGTTFTIKLPILEGKQE